MKKSNVVIFVLLALASAFFLWLWFFLGLNRVDEPLDLVLSIVWWAVVVVAIAVIVKMERTRRRRIRTVYVGDGLAFNSEAGLVELEEGVSTQEAVAAILDKLTYDFTRNDFPDEDEFRPKFFIRTKEFEADEPKEESEQSPEQESASAFRKWKGEVFLVDAKQERPFDTPEELSAILASPELAA